MLFADTRQALRVLLRSPGFTLVAVSALALGIGANTALFSVVNTVLLRPLPYPDPDRLTSLIRTFKEGESWAASIPEFMAWRSNDAFEAIAAYDFSGPGLNLSGGDRPEQVKGIHASADFFRVFGVSPMLGRGFTQAEDRPGGAHVAVLSNGVWKSHFGGDPRLIGSTIHLNGEPYTVVGVMPAWFTPAPPADIWIPLEADSNSGNPAHYLRVAGRMKPGMSIQAAAARQKVIAEQYRRAHPKLMEDGETFGVISLLEMTVRDVRPALLILLGAVGFVLLIACANVANLLLARASGREKEMAIRSAIGASRFRVVRQLLTESVLLATIGGVLGFGAGLFGVRALLAISPGDIPRVSSGGAAPALALDWRVLAFTVGISLLTGIVFGVLPALKISRVDLNSTLKQSSGRSGTGLKQNRTRAVLVISEVALAMVLLTGAGLLIESFGQLRGVKPGFDPHDVLTMQTSLAAGKFDKTANVSNFTRQVVQRMEALPGVQAASNTLFPPAENNIDMDFFIEGKPAPKAGDANGDEDVVYSSAHYFAVFKIPLLRGRLIQDTDTGQSTPVMLISEAFAKKYFSKEDPIGQRITIGRGAGPGLEDVTRQIAGVVGDVRQNGLDQPDAPVMYIPSPQMPDALNKLTTGVAPLTWVVRTNSDPQLLRPALEREILAVDAQMPVAQVRSMDQVLGTSLARQNFNMLLLSIFAGIALLLAAIGIYGLMAYAVEQRQHEIGIRVAMGASRQDVLKMVLGQGMQLALAGVAIGLAAAFGLTRLLSAMLFGVKPTDPATFAGVACLLSVIALLACYLPARRAMDIDPVVALRVQ